MVSGIAQSPQTSYINGLILRPDGPLAGLDGAIEGYPGPEFGLGTSAVIDTSQLSSAALPKARQLYAEQDFLLVHRVAADTQTPLRTSVRGTASDGS